MNTFRGSNLPRGFLLHEKSSCRSSAARWPTTAIPQGANIKLQFRYCATESVSVHAELARGLALVAIVFLKNGEDEALLELSYGFRIKNPTVVHLQDEGFQLILHV